jgi:replicative DNA helicase
MPLTIIDAPSITPGRLSRLVRRHIRRFEARGHKLELVVVDYIQRMRPDRQMSKKYEEVSEISAALKDIAKANGVAIMALAQLSREVERRGDKRPVLADLRDSGQLEQDADTVIFLLRQEYYHRQAEPDPMSPDWPGWNDSLSRMTGEIEFIVPKRRGGETGAAKGVFHGAFQAVRG